MCRLGGADGYLQVNRDEKIHLNILLQQVSSYFVRLLEKVRGHRFSQQVFTNLQTLLPDKRHEATKVEQCHKAATINKGLHSSALIPATSNLEDSRRPSKC